MANTSLLAKLGFPPIPLTADLTAFRAIKETDRESFLFPQKKKFSKKSPPEGEERVYHYFNGALRTILNLSRGEDSFDKMHKSIESIVSLKLNDEGDLGKLIQEVHIRQFCGRLGEICWACGWSNLNKAKWIAYYENMYNFLRR